MFYPLGIAFSLLLIWEHVGRIYYPTKRPTYFCHRFSQACVPIFYWLGSQAARLGLIYDHIFDFFSEFFITLKELLFGIIRLVVDPVQAYVEGFHAVTQTLASHFSVFFTYLWWTAIETVLARLLTEWFFTRYAAETWSKITEFGKVVSILLFFACFHLFIFVFLLINSREPQVVQEKRRVRTRSRVRPNIEE